MPKQKPRARKRKKEGSKEIAKKLELVGKDLVSDIKKHKDPAFVTSQRGRSNVVFDEKRCLLTLGGKKTTRNLTTGYWSRIY